MKEESKFYTPEISEFHVGFEYENKLIEGHWNWHGETDKVTFSLNTNLEGIKDYPHLVRVKHLDRDDIERLGFTTGGVMWEYRTGKARIYQQSPEYGKYRWTIQVVDGSGNWSDSFSGTIKNKSELKRILKQIGI